MILGPTAPHPRAALHVWCDADETEDFVFEHGLVPIARDVCFEDHVVVDVLARDASGAPVAMLGFDGEDQDDALPRIVDLDCWYEEAREVLQHLPGAELRADAPLRVFVIVSDVSPSFFARLQRLRDIDLAVFELRSLRVAGKRRTVLTGVAPWDSGSSLQAPAAPLGGEGRVAQQECLEKLLSCLASLPGTLTAFGDRYWRQYRLAGQPVLELQVRSGLLWAELPGNAAEAWRSPLREQGDVDRVLDVVLRHLLQSEERDAPAESRADADRRSGPELPTTEMSAPEPRRPETLRLERRRSSQLRRGGYATS